MTRSVPKGEYPQARVDGEADTQTALPPPNARRCGQPGTETVAIHV